MTLIKQTKIEEIFKILHIIDEKVINEERSTMEIFQTRIYNSISFLMTITAVIVIYYFYLYVSKF